MWFFKKQNKKIIIKAIAFKEITKVRVGFTEVNLVFSDGRTFMTYVYGNVDQYFTVEYKKNLQVWVNATVIPFYVQKSEDVAKQYLKTCYYDSSEEVVVVDDPKNPNKSVKGKIIEASLGKTIEDYTVDFNEAYLIDKEVEI